MGSLAFFWRVFWARRQFQNMELRFNEVLAIAKCLAARAEGCRFLIFGLGYDSPLWQKLNGAGRTVFLENHPEWYERIMNRHPDLEAYRVEYSTRLSQWKNLLNRPESLAMNLPAPVASTQWDVILVDAPKGDPENFRKYGWEPPGRMQSIYMAGRLAARGGDVLVHDCERTVENEYSEKFLSPLCEGFSEIRGRGLLRHYQVP